MKIIITEYQYKIISEAIWNGRVIHDHEDYQKLANIQQSYDKIKNLLITKNVGTNHPSIKKELNRVDSLTLGKIPMKFKKLLSNYKEIKQKEIDKKNEQERKNFKKALIKMGMDNLDATMISIEAHKAKKNGQSIDLGDYSFLQKYNTSEITPSKLMEQFFIFQIGAYHPDFKWDK